jgi:hypothetical protein
MGGRGRSLIPVFSFGLISVGVCVGLGFRLGLGKELGALRLGLEVGDF